jgi:hypothetical protein
VAFNGELTTVATGNVGMSPGTSVNGNYIVAAGSTEINSTPANKCADDRIIAYNKLQGLTCPPANMANELGGGPSKKAGIYCDAGAPLTLSTGMTLEGAADDVWVFQGSSSFISSLNTKILLKGEAKAENVFWVVGASATIGTSSEFVGTLIAYASISLNTRATVNGRALAGAAVSCENSNTITNPNPK